MMIEQTCLFNYTLQDSPVSLATWRHFLTMVREHWLLIREGGKKIVLSLPNVI